MRRLYAKIFIWFLVAFVLVGGALVFLALEAQSEFARQRIEENDMKLTPPFADRWATVLERQDMPGLSVYKARATAVGNRMYFFGSDGIEKFGATAPKQTRSLVQQATQTDETQIA